MKKKVLVYYDGFTAVIGGSEFLPLTLIHELQARGHDVTLVTQTPADLELVQRQYGVTLNLHLLKCRTLAPDTGFEKLINRIFRCVREWKLHRLARGVEVCISTANPVDFGRPAHHFIYMIGFTDGFRKSLGLPSALKGRETIVRRVWRGMTAWLANRLIVRVRSADEILSDSRERVYPNSNWARSQIEDYFKCRTSPVFYPPTIVEPVACTTTRCENQVACIGRIDPRKRIDCIIAIVEQVRQATGRPLTLMIAGYVKNDVYGRQITALARERPWVHILGPLYGDEKNRLLMTSRYAVHARTDEEFGISIVEYLKAGLVPVVPAVGGAAEVIGDKRLTYEEQAKAVGILRMLVEDSSFYDEMKTFCSNRARLFSAESFWKSQSDLLDTIGL